MPLFDFFELTARLVNCLLQSVRSLLDAVFDKLFLN